MLHTRCIGIIHLIWYIYIYILLLNIIGILFIIACIPIGSSTREYVYPYSYSYYYYYYLNVIVIIMIIIVGIVACDATRCLFFVSDWKRLDCHRGFGRVAFHYHALWKALLVFFWHVAMRPGCLAIGSGEQICVSGATGFVFRRDQIRVSVVTGVVFWRD